MHGAYWVYLTFLENRIIYLHFFSLIVYVYLHSMFSGGLRKTIFFCKNAFRPFKVIQGHWFSYQLPIKCAYATSCLSIIVTLVLSCTVSEILQAFVLPALPVFHPNFGGKLIPVGPDR